MEGKLLALYSIHLLEIDYPAFLKKVYTLAAISVSTFVFTTLDGEIFIQKQDIFCHLKAMQKLSWRSTCISLQQKSKLFSVNCSACIVMEIRKAPWQWWTKSTLSWGHTFDFIEGIRPGDYSTCRKQEGSTNSTVFHLFCK